MSATPARWAALDVLRAVRAGELADRALVRARERVAPRERAWLHELVYGVLRLRGRLDHALARYVRRGLSSLDPDILDVLRLGAYQLLEMASVPAYAAVSQAVEMGKALAGRGAGGLVNGVLQSLRREQATLAFPDFASDPGAHLASWGSHPPWLVERWLARFGAEGARELVEANNRRPELYLRPVGVALEAARAVLRGAGIESEPVPIAPDALRVLPPATAREALRAVPAIVQDPAAGLVVRYAAAAPGARVADLCAAPGGKALGLAQAVIAGESDGYVLAADASWDRLGRLRENLERLRADPAAAPVAGRVGLAVADARWPAVGGADVVLLDVPCTGTGTLRRHPDGRWRIGPTDLAALVELQRELLAAAAPLVRRGGLLVYATCSLEPEENESQVEWFLQRHPQFAIETVPGAVDAALRDEGGRLIVLPHQWDVDGAFAARLRRLS
ncbi:MAG: 16S rRNA (cytosine(967)-C(5))-methyltransferase RsmB [Gemmatimonadetes bacterium]|nr:16S rRNA (cytosine(967)-C(5))-methyltransferase RsmB [Gemmatimonadota bacterium]